MTPFQHSPLPNEDNATQPSDAVSDAELLAVIKDFLEMGHVDTIVAMFVRRACPFSWTGPILDDERFAVRLGVAVLFEELRQRVPQRLNEAIDSLLPLLDAKPPHLRGDALGVLGTIGTPEALRHVERMTTDAHPLVREIAVDILTTSEKLDPTEPL